jgi:hypothetical protein
VTRTQIYLTEAEQLALRALARATGKTQSELIRSAIDRFVASFDEDAKRKALMAAAGIWKRRADLPDFGSIRREADRRLSTRRARRSA